MWEPLPRSVTQDSPRRRAVMWEPPPPLPKSVTPNPPPTQGRDLETLPDVVSDLRPEYEGRESRAEAAPGPGHIAASSTPQTMGGGSPSLIRTAPARSRRLTFRLLMSVSGALPPPALPEPPRPGLTLLRGAATRRPSARARRLTAPEVWPITARHPPACDPTKSALGIMGGVEAIFVRGTLVAAPFKRGGGHVCEGHPPEARPRVWGDGGKWLFTRGRSLSSSPRRWAPALACECPAALGCARPGGWRSPGSRRWAGEALRGSAPKLPAGTPAPPASSLSPAPVERSWPSDGRTSRGSALSVPLLCSPGLTVTVPKALPSPLSGVLAFGSSGTVH